MKTLLWYVTVYRIPGCPGSLLPESQQLRQPHFRADGLSAKMVFPLRRLFLHAA